MQRRLTAIARSVARVANAIAFFPEDRLVIRAAQTGRRLSSHPSQMIDELSSLSKLVGHLPDNLLNYNTAYRVERGGHEEGDRLLRAREDLLTALEQFPLG